MSDTGDLWRDVKRERRAARDRRAEARFNAIRRYVRAGLVKVIIPLGEHGVRLAVPGNERFRVDYWPGSGVAQVVGTRRPCKYGASVGDVLELLGVDRKAARRDAFNGGEHGDTDTEADSR